MHVQCIFQSYREYHAVSLQSIQLVDVIFTAHSRMYNTNIHMCLQIDFVPAAVKVYSTELVLFVAETGMEIFSLPISAKSEVPAITLETPYLDYGRCFLQYPYTLTVTLNNPSRLPVKYEMHPPRDERVLRYSTNPASGVIDPHSTLNLPLQIEPQVVGEIVSAAVFRILGSPEDPLKVTLRCIGEGPVINVSSTELHWGRQPVLIPLPKTVYLSNESLIPAEFECVLVSRPDLITVRTTLIGMSQNDKLDRPYTFVHVHIHVSQILS